MNKLKNSLKLLMPNSVYFQVGASPRLQLANRRGRYRC